MRIFVTEPRKKEKPNGQILVTEDLKTAGERRTPSLSGSAMALSIATDMCEHVAQGTLDIDLLNVEKKKSGSRRWRFRQRRNVSRPWA